MHRVPMIRFTRARNPEYEARRLKRRFATITDGYLRAVTARRRWRRTGWFALAGMAFGAAAMAVMLWADLLSVAFFR